MKLIIGLGNFEDKYLNTRHNAGFLFVDFLQAKLKLPQFKTQAKFFCLLSKSNDIVLAKPTTYMNGSGRAVSALVNFYNFDISQLIVVHDDLDIELGSFKLQFGKGPKIHNGLASIYQHLGTDQFWHLRLGVDDRKGDRSVPGASYVLLSLSEDNKTILNKVFEQAIAQLDQTQNLI